MRTSDTEVEYVSGLTPEPAAADNLVWTGRFRSDQIPFKHGESWLGLFREGSKYSIRRTKLTVSKVKEPGSVDIEVGTERSARSLFLVRNMPFIKEREVTTVWDEETTEQASMPLSDKPRTFVLAGKTYTLTVEGTKEGRLAKGSKLVIDSGKDRQVLRTLDNDCSDCAWTVIWAGDLDLDGKLDLFMDLADQPETTEKVLFVSSQSIGGKLVKHVASLRLSLSL
jgi:hypothetical protein